MADSRYIGITIGPIYDTITLTSSPAGLWAASYMFSYIARELCINLSQMGVRDDDFISPYFERHNARSEGGTKGLGLYHDRIIIRSDFIGLGDVNRAIEKTQGQVAEILSKGLQRDKPEVQSYLADYLQIYAVELEIPHEENPILALSQYLDALENQKKFVHMEKENLLLSFFEAKGTDDDSEASKNIWVKNSDFVNVDCGGFQNWPLADDVQKGKIKRMKDIASCGQAMTMKKQQYYAIVQADGDNMGQILKSLKGDAPGIRAFSKRCFDFAKAAAELIKEYGGINIYVGGDDLLFIAPVENKGQKTIFDLLSDVEEVFGKVFHKMDDKLTLSFGVAVHYVKYPLYESLAEARSLLFEFAKQTASKNTTALSFHKHSGQKFRLMISNTMISERYKELCSLFRKQWELSRADEFLHSVAYKFLEFRSLFIRALLIDDTAIRNLFDNLFDSEVHGVTPNAQYIKSVSKFLIDIHHDADSISTQSAGSGDNPEEKRAVSAIDTVSVCLKILGFFTEKGREEKGDAQLSCQIHTS